MNHHHHHHHHHPEEETVEDSQVRSIIRQLNEDTPGKIKGREVVVRPDGSKVVRVTKKRKAMVTKEEKSRHGRRVFMQALFAFFFLLAAFGAFFFYRMTTMSGERYLMSRSSELEQRWGAASVRCTGAVIDGINFHISNIVAEFPESSMVARVELSELDAELDLGSFVTGVMTGDELKIARAHVYLRPGARELHLPQAVGEKLWRFLRVSCPDFSLSFAGDSSPWSIRHTNAYMYRPSTSSPLTVVTLEGGSMQMRGWKTVSIQSAKAHFSQLAMEDFTLSGTTDGAAVASESSKTSVTFSGSLAEGGALEGPYYIVSDNMSIDEFTESRFNHFFAARTVRPSMRSGTPSTQVRLPLERSFPQFSGTFHLKDISISGFPAQQVIAEHLEPVKRKRYLPPSILFGSARLEHDGDAMTLRFDESGMTERDVITLRGNFRVDGSSELSGTLDYGIPAALTHAEYRDGKADPLFREDGQLAWVATRVYGPASRPQDNSHELDAAAVPERASRERIPFEDIDLDRVNEFFRNREQLLQQSYAPGMPADPPAGTTQPQAEPQPQEGQQQPVSPLDPFAPASSALDSPF